jgi:integrase
MSNNTEQSQQTQASEQTQLSQIPGVVEETASTTVEDKPKRLPKLKYRPDGVCEAPGCGKPVPGGMVQINVTRYFCSDYCRNKEARTRDHIGDCAQCGEPLMGEKADEGKVRCCSVKCDTEFRNELMFELTGPFRKLIEEYLAVAGGSYAESSLSGVKTSLTKFFGHAYTTEKIEKLEDIGPSVMTRFIAAERARGITSSNCVGHVSTFFNSLIAEERFDKRNPVVRRIHAGLNPSRPRQPYEDSQMSFLWRMVEATDNTQLKLMFAIGEESGLRNSEVCNIRLEDIDQVKQTIYVRLPTKNKEPRTVPFHNKVKKFLQQWLLERDPRCAHNHLLHNSFLRRLTRGTLDDWFKNLYSGKPEPAASFEFHRLRHTWATRLVNADMELPVLQQLGGWKSLRSVQVYAKIRQSTVDRQYEASYAVIEEKLESPQEETLSLFDFALMDDSNTATPPIQLVSRYCR